MPCRRPDLAGTEVLVLLGARDAYRNAGERLAAALTGAGASVEVVTLDGSHDLIPEDDRAIRSWLDASRSA